jgi:uncharacterized membrane protein YoaK (UPF0700 family)
MPALHTPDAIFSLRHVPSWLMLTFAAGCVNATAVLACDRFVTHVTGTVTRIGMDIGQIVLVLDLLLVLFCFVLGAMTSGLLINARLHAGKRPWYAVPLVAVAVIDLFVGITGELGWFGPFGGAVDEPGDFWLLALLSFAMGLQNGAVATSTGMLVRTTHLTGPATDLGLHCAELMFAEGTARTRARQHALLRLGKISAFAAGAGVPFFLVADVGYLVLVLPAVVTLIATWISFFYSDAAIERRLTKRANQPPRAVLLEDAHMKPYINEVNP